MGETLICVVLAMMPPMLKCETPESGVYVCTDINGNTWSGDAACAKIEKPTE